MGQFLVKVFVTAILVAGISELGKRSSLAGAILASLPLSSLLALAWLYGETGDDKAVARLSMRIFWMVIPSLAFFPLLVVLLRHIPFWWSLIAASAATAVLYTTFVWTVGFFGIRI